jgi:hypothetical protein
MGADKRKPSSKSWRTMASLPRMKCVMLLLFG